MYSKKYPKEEEIKRALAEHFQRRGHTVFRDVNTAKSTQKPICIKDDEQIIIHFFTEPDIILIKKDENDYYPKIIGIEIKGYRKDKIPPFREAFGQAMLYLVNPKIIYSDGRTIYGSIFDEVYICYPYTENYKEEDVRAVEKLTPIGLMAWDDGELNYIIKARPNPYMRNETKDIFMKCINIINKSLYEREMLERFLGK